MKYPLAICVLLVALMFEMPASIVQAGEIEDMRAGASVHTMKSKMLEDLLDESDTDSDAGAYQDEGETTDMQEQSEEEEHRQPELLKEESADQEQSTVMQESKSKSNEELVTAAGRPSCYRNIVRLVGGRVPNEGRVEVLYGKRWGSVCQRNFDLKDALVVCKQLGYTGAIAVRKNAFFGKSSGAIWLDKLQCRGAEQSVYHCGHRPVGVATGCTHNHDVGVVCYTPAVHTYCDKVVKGNGKVCLRNARYDLGRKHVCGRVDVLFKGRYGTVCDDKFDIRDARVICRQLGYYKGASKAYTCGTSCGGRGKNIWLNNMLCRGSESKIAKCRSTLFKRHNCGHNEDAGVCCNV